MKKKIIVIFFLLMVIVPTVYGAKKLEVSETDFVRLKPNATDEDAQRLVYTFTEPLDENGEWQTGYGDAGEYPITVTVSDGETSTSQEVLLVVNKKEEAPTIDSFEPIGDVSIDEGKSIEFKVSASDLNNDELSYSWKFDDNVVGEGKSSYVYIPDYESQGSHAVEVVVSDETESVSHEWNVNVNNVDRKAILDSIPDIEVLETETASLELPDFSAFGLKYTITEPLGNENSWKTTYDDAGDYIVGVNVFDDSGFRAFKNVKITVKNKDRAPVFKSVPSVSVREAEEVNVEFEATDPDGEVISYSAENLPAGAYLSKNKFLWVTDYDTVKKENLWDNLLDKLHLLNKKFIVDITAKSGESEVRKKLKIRVWDVNREPMLEDMDDIIVNEGDTVVIEPRATDPDGDKISFSYSGWMNSNTKKTGYEDAGEYVVKVSVNDGRNIISKDVKITVNQSNRAPVLMPIETVTVNEDESVTVGLSAYDPDGDSINFSSSGLPEGAVLEGSVFKWKPAFSATKNKTIYNIDFKATDGSLETVQRAMIEVNNVNRPPEIIDVSPVTDFIVKKKTPVLFEVIASDPDGDELEYKWIFSFLEKYTGTAAMQRVFTVSGDKTVKIIVSDGVEKAEHEWKVKVR